MAQSLLLFINKRLEPDNVHFLPRCDYKEFLELMKLLLGGSLEQKKGYTYTVQGPGTDHHTRWISKAIYILKMVLLQHQLPELHWQTKKVTTISFFVVLSTWSTGSLLPPSSLLASLIPPDMDPYPHVHKVLTAMDPPGGDHPVWQSQTGIRRGDDGVKNIRFFGEICCSRTIFARVFKVEIVLWY